MVSQANQTLVSRFSKIELRETFCSFVRHSCHSLIYICCHITKTSPTKFSLFNLSLSPTHKLMVLVANMEIARFSRCTSANVTMGICVSQVLPRLIVYIYVWALLGLLFVCFLTQVLQYPVPISKIDFSVYLTK